jgi:hypothetical protein
MRTPRSLGHYLQMEGCGLHDVGRHQRRRMEVLLEGNFASMPRRARALGRASERNRPKAPGQASILKSPRLTAGANSFLRSLPVIRRLCKLQLFGYIGQGAF